MTARIRADELAQITPLLGLQGMMLFGRMSRKDQRHALNVYTTLVSQGYTEQPLLVAALLHDIGKTAGALPVFYRVLIVLLTAFSPRLLAWLAQEERGPLMTPFRVSVAHATSGAEMLRASGFDATTVELVLRHHEAPPVDDPLAPWLTALQEADGAN